MKKIIFDFIKPISCESSNLCSDLIVDKLELAFSCKLKAIIPNDTVNGSVSIYHKNGEHEIHIEFYNEDRNPEIELSPTGQKLGFRKSTLKKLLTIPTKEQVGQKLL